MEIIARLGFVVREPKEKPIGIRPTVVLLEFARPGMHSDRKQPELNLCETQAGGGRALSFSALGSQSAFFVLKN